MNIICTITTRTNGQAEVVSHMLLKEWDLVGHISIVSDTSDVMVSMFHKNPMK